MSLAPFFPISGTAAAAGVEKMKVHLPLKIAKFQQSIAIEN